MVQTLPSKVNDLRTIQGTISEHVRVHGQFVLYERQDLRNDELLDDLHGEVLDSARRFKPPVKLLTMIQANPTSYQLTKWGIDGQREVVLYPAVVTLVEAGLARFQVEDDVTTRPRFDIAIGDRFTWDDSRYEVLEIVREKYWGNTGVPLYLRLTAAFWRESTADVECPDGNIGGPTFGGTGSALGDECRQ